MLFLSYGYIVPRCNKGWGLLGIRGSIEPGRGTRVHHTSSQDWDRQEYTYPVNCEKVFLAYVTCSCFLMIFFGAFIIWNGWFRRNFPIQFLHWQLHSKTMILEVVESGVQPIWLQQDSNTCWGRVLLKKRGALKISDK